MLGISLRFETRLDIIQSLQMIGGATQSIFPQVEALLLGAEGDYRKAIIYIAARKNMENYDSIMDFLFCELHPEWRLPCRKFYAGMGPKLSGMITMAQLVEYNERLLIALEIALKHFSEHRQRSWASYREKFKEAIASAA